MSNDYNNGAWWGWNGGDCPVHPKTEVECATETGISVGLSGQWDWSVFPFPVVAFRVVKAYREPREWWVNENPGGAFIYGTKEDADRWARNDRIRCIHVREVLE